ncbi:MAG: hypothetical protein K2N06_05525 [Oscillospiraceae bacterium]|nr:hypothetical protein [Oscillospiraceae bacterium]
MSDDYKRGFITGMAMQPLCVVEGGGEAVQENFCADTVLVGDTISNDGYCKNIEF